MSSPELDRSSFSTLTDPPRALQILYEDEVLLFVNKPPGIVVQRGYDPDEPVLLEDVESYLAGSRIHPFLMQRLDRGTSGVIFFSKSERINARLTRQFEKRQIRKTYWAICEKELTLAQRIDAPLARIGPIKFGVRRDGKRALTKVRPRGWSPSATLVEVNLMTGRTHQIRAHLAAIGHPLVGDWLYGNRNASRPMLHAAELRMRHPLSSEELTVSAALPLDFLQELAARGIEAP